MAKSNKELWLAAVKYADAWIEAAIACETGDEPMTAEDREWLFLMREKAEAAVLRLKVQRMESYD